MKQPLTRTELQDLHSVLRRAAERIERRKRRGIPDNGNDNDNDPHADALARQVTEIEAELAGDT